MLVDLTQDMKWAMASSDPEQGLERLFRVGLDWMAKVVPYDLAAIFALEKGKLVLKESRGPLAGKKLAAHSLDLKAFPSIQHAIEMRRAHAFLEHDHAEGDGDPFDGVLDLPHGHSCMVVPLCGGDRCFGIMTLDRQACEPYEEERVSLAEVFGFLLGLALDHFNERVAFQRLHSQEKFRSELYERDLEGSENTAFEKSASPLMQLLYRQVLQVAPTDTPVLILGETGTGKERLANAIHRLSRRAQMPFLRLNCAAIPENLLESELFGHKKGAFTGASAERLGRFQAANGGTLLLDEMGEMPLALQAKLLRVLQEGTFEPVGSDKTIKVDVRIMAATHRNLHKSVESGKFREDLYYRINVFPLQLPALRDRLEDLPLLTGSLLQEIGERIGKRHLVVQPEALARLTTYAWPGNVRELANVLERAAILCRGTRIQATDLALLDTAIGNREPAKKTASITTLDQSIKAHILAVLQHCEGKIYGSDGAARLLGLKPTTLQSKMKKLGIQKEVLFKG
ncbi:MAG: sigma 54-interacting transcriptional regulator [Acidobacteria bacterium]|nr:sigma 54-interacting transcriptional regulator [Acidobacteriota bacterium]